jgi:hypothetical protein
MGMQWYEHMYVSMNFDTNSNFGTNTASIDDAFFT